MVRALRLRGSSLLVFANRQMVRNVLCQACAEMQQMIAWSKRRQHHPEAVGNDGEAREQGWIQAKDVVGREGRREDRRLAPHDRRLEIEDDRDAVERGFQVAPSWGTSWGT